jgi:hypothetical protein
MNHNTLKTALTLIIAAPLLASAVSAAPVKKAKPMVTTEIVPRDGRPGYAAISLENGAKNVLRVVAGESRAALPNIMANDVDFITVVGAQTVATVYEQPNFRGHSLTLRCGNYELLQQPRNDIESIKVRYVKEPVSECQGSDMELVQMKTWDR